MDDLPPLIILFAIIGFGSLLLPSRAIQSPEIQPEPQNTLLEPRSAIETPDYFAGLKYRTLITCLAKHESGFRIDVYGDNSKAYGILQFHRPTFDAYCDGNYFDPKDQTECCDQMLISDFSNLRHWTTAKYCLVN